VTPMSSKGADRAAAVPPFPKDLLLVPVSRWPTTLPEETARVVIETPLDRAIPLFSPKPGFVPHTSIVVATHDGLPFTRLCLESVLAAASSPLASSSPGQDFEVVVVDNGSTDGTLEYLGELSHRDGRVRVEANRRNAGFAVAVNQGAAIARGQVLLFLNNDTIVPAGALELLIGRVADPGIGLLGTVTNRAGNEAEIDVPYRTYGDFDRFARDHAHTHAGEIFDIRTATMFCAAVRRQVWNEVGSLDERFEVGLFEDDDYAIRVRQAGCRVVCAEDVFVHHFGQASIGHLGPTGQYGNIFHTNRARWEAKWGVAWKPYERRAKPGYQALVERIRRVACATVPLDATVLVVSKGDEELLKLEGRRAWHFPQSDKGTYAGYYPADGQACIAELKRMREKGADFLLFPSIGLWWLDHYREFGDHLQGRYPFLAHDEFTCVIFDLREARSLRSNQAASEGEDWSARREAGDGLR